MTKNIHRGKTVYLKIYVFIEFMIDFYILNIE